jgi:3-oxoacyl-[acyl-carrier protein] reductase
MSHNDQGMLRGKVVVVTGGASGMGKIYATEIAGAGARVVITDLHADAAEAAAGEIRRTGADALGVGADIRYAEEVEKIASATREHFDAIDGLVNNAALMSELPRRSWLDIPIEEWDHVMAVNMRGTFLMCRAFHPLFRKSGGSIVNIASTRALDGTPNRLHYTTSKAGIRGLTRALAREVGGNWIRVNAIAPGLTLTDNQVASSDPAYLTKIAEGRALERPQRPQDLVGTVLFLLSDAGSFITGQTIVVDGGRIMH